MPMWRGGPRPATIPAKPVEVVESGPDVVADLNGLGRLSDARRELLALALHERWHGHSLDRWPSVGCAEKAGAYEDVAAIEPLIVRWLAEAERGDQDEAAS